MSFKFACIVACAPFIAAAAGLDDLKPAPEGANRLAADEKAEGWSLLWDGTSTNAWVSKKDLKTFPDRGWVMKDGWLGMKKKGGGGDLVTVEKYRDFIFAFDFQLTKGANSGVKYYFDENQNGGTCEEYQVLDNAHPDSKRGKDGNRKCASLYDLIPAKADDILRPLGEWNSGRIVARGGKVEHWLNGVKVLEYERGSAAFREAVNASKYAKWGVGLDGKPRPWGENVRGRILLQDHSDSTVSFRNLKVKSWNCQ